MSKSTYKEFKSIIFVVRVDKYRYLAYYSFHDVIFVEFLKSLTILKGVL